MASGPSWMQRDQLQGEGLTATDRGIGADGTNEPNASYGAIKAEMTDTNAVRFGFRVASLALGLMMIIAAFTELWNLSSFTTFFIALYNLLFAGVLILHESQGLIMCDGVDYTMRRYFGLVYGHMGRALFIIFIAFLNFALTDAGWFATFTGLLLLLHGGAMIVVFTKYPHLLDEAPGLGDLKTTAPPRQDEYAPPPTMPSTSL
ncbi:unnamed protein product [Ectocarpus sp. 6 AP-2014]